MTPLEGLDYPYLTISQGDKVIEYRGIHVSRMAPTKDSYVLIEAGKTITSPVVDLTSSYKFDSDGIYTIEYTKPFVYISDAEMSMIDDDKNPPQATGHSYDDLVASTEIELRDTYYLKPTNYEVQTANNEFEEKTSLGDDTVYVSDGCRYAFLKNTDQITPTSGETRYFIERDVKELHTTLCLVAFPLAITDATSNSKKAPYTTFFGSASNTDVLKALNKVTNGLQKNTKTSPIYYYFKGPLCKEKNYMAYAYFGKHEVYFCQEFEDAPKFIDRGTFYNNYDSKFEIMAHEYMHVFAELGDHKYGYQKCKTMIRSVWAIDNADSYGFYVQSLYDAKGK